MRRLGFSEGSSGPQGAPGSMFEAAASWHSPFVLLAPSRSPRVPQGPVTCGCLKALCLCADRRFTILHVARPSAVRDEKSQWR